MTKNGIRITTGITGTDTTIVGEHEEVLHCLTLVLQNTAALRSVLYLLDAV